MTSVARYVHTLRYLRPVQVFGRLWYQAQRPRPDLRPAPALRQLAATYVGPIAPTVSLLAADRVCLLNVERSCIGPADWQPAEASRLWIYHLHYCDDLNAQAAPARVAWHRAWLERWVRDNPPTVGPGWEPYPLSRRIVNWVKWALRGNELPHACRESLAVQARWLGVRLEQHILGNHLFANAVALLHAGLFFEGAEAQALYRRGLAILNRELPEQVLADGAHFELSPMYHALVLADLLDLVNLHRAYAVGLPASWPGVIARMQRWLEVLTHPDGEIAFFNDAAFGAAPTAAQTAAYATRLHLPSPDAAARALTALEPSGYLRAQSGAAVLLCDCAAVGPDHLPAHAHADTLSCELSLHGRRVLVNSGVSRYGADAERLRQRGTPAHNTVVLDSQDSSEVWGGFRTARRARVFRRGAHATDVALEIEAAHDGYRRLRGRNEHYRHWRLEPHALTVQDRISGPFKSAQAFWHLHPAIDVETAAAGYRLRAADLPSAVQMQFSGAASVEMRPGSWHPEFGIARANRCLVVTFAGAELTTRLEWN